MYFNKSWADGIILPNGCMAHSTKQLDNYLRDNDLSLSSDYSAAYLKNKRQRNEKAQRAELFSDFIHNYKRSIWNDR